jgi:hypothetical protein
VYNETAGQVAQRKGTRRWTSLKNIRRSENSPLPLLERAHFPQSLAPAEYAFLARIYFLPAANQADAGTPIRMPRHQFENERWLRRGTFEFLYALLLIPGALRLVEDKWHAHGEAPRATHENSPGESH